MITGPENGSADGYNVVIMIMIKNRTLVGNHHKHHLIILISLSAGAKRKWAVQTKNRGLDQFDIRFLRD